MSKGKVFAWIFVNNTLGSFSQQIIGTKSTKSARYCYSVFMRHLIHYYDHNRRLPATVAELGPGDTIGTGIAALLSGVEKYYAIDAVKHANVDENIRLFNELLEMFLNKEDIPDNYEFPKVKPEIDDYAFPSNIIDEKTLMKSLSFDRIDEIRNEILKNGGKRIEYFAPWNNSNIIMEKSIDFIFSQAVLEHIDDIDSVYYSMKKWIKSDGLMSHTIDFKSHNTSSIWNGHWCYSNMVWKIIRGRAVYLINRLPYSEHVKLFDKHNLNQLYVKKYFRYDGVNRQKLNEHFFHITDEDLLISGAHIILGNK